LRDAYHRMLRHRSVLLAALVAYTAAFALLGWTAAKRIVGWQEEHRGIVYGWPPSSPLACVQPMGVNVSLEQYASEAELRSALQLIRQAGFHWVRQRFPWSEIEPNPGTYAWEPWDRIVSAVQEEGLGLIAVLESSPRWARPDADADNPLAPPRALDDFGAFVAACARRFGGVIDYYQIWDQPNIAPHWGAGDVDPAAYVRMLRTGWQQVKANDDCARRMAVAT